MNSQDQDESNIQQDWSPTMFSVFEEDSNSSCSSVATSILSPRTTECEDLDSEDKICAVCGDKANGYHFHVLTCEGCKGFFRRSISKGLTFTCPFTGSCPVTKTKRRRCQACRLQKCLDVGMRKDMIMTEDALLARRALRMRKKQERLQKVPRVAEIGSLSEEQKQLISILIDANRKHFDSKFENFKNYRLQPQVVKTRWGNSPISSSACSPQNLGQYPESPEMMEGVVPTDDFRELPHFADLSTYLIHQVIKFAKEIPAFRSLSMEDQIALLKGATMEVSQIQFNAVFNLETNQWEFGKIRLSIEDGALTGFQQVYLEPVLKFHVNFRKLKLHEPEYVLMQALALFSPDRTGIIEHDLIDGIHEKTALTLKCYIDYHHPLPDSRFLYAKLLSLLAELRTLNEENAKQMIHIQNIMSDAMTPLMKEIFS